MSSEADRVRVDWSTIAVGAVLARYESYFVPSTRITVLKRTPKYVHLSDGQKIHVETTGKSNYSVWSEDHEREIERRRDKRNAEERIARLRMSMSIEASGGILTYKDALRDPASILELEELDKIFNAQRTRIIERMIAERPKE